MNPYSKLVALISSEFSRYLIDHEDVAKKIPKNALIIFQIEGEHGFNSWSKDVSSKNREKNQPIIYVNVKKWRQKASVEELDVIVD